jgi:hypothetical protein
MIEEKKEEKICFVIAPIGEPNSETRKISDQIFNHLISATITALGYKPVRADHISEPGIISSQVVQHVLDSPLVIADLTGRNPNVFYELAIRHAVQKPVIQIIMEEEQIPFDIAGTRTIRFDIHDLDSVQEAKSEIVRQIRSIEKGFAKTENPISVAIDMKILKESRNPEERSLADLIEAVSMLRLGISAIESRLKNPESLIPLDYLRDVFRELTHRLRASSRTIAEDIREITDDLTNRQGLTASELEELRERLLKMAGRIDIFLREA